ncbi:MAG TPA: tetratricopeptide repeat protein [Steroidobacteraceae bacterium]|nr:tetratricopeptide repeat protein [Steroidobacteraceae bacterium]
MLRFRSSLAAFLGVATLLLLAAAAGAQDKGTLKPVRIKDLSYGEVLFYFYQDDYFDSLTRLLAAEDWNRIPHHSADAELLRGGLYLSLGNHNEAGAIFERLLKGQVSPGVRNRAWYYLAKVWYQRGYYDKAEATLRRIIGSLPEQMDADRRMLMANILLREGRYDDAIAELNGWRGPPDWTAYAQFNLGVALVRKGRLADAAHWLDGVGTLETDNEELKSLKDKANLALGFAYIQADQPAVAKPYLERVRLDGPQSTKALLGVGWADAAQGDYRGALVPWMELHGRNLLDSAVQEAYLAVPYAFGKLGANKQAADNYTTAIQSYDAEVGRLDESIQAIREGRMLNAIVERESTGRLGWFWQLRTLPDAPESRYLYHLLATNEFQEGLKNYRDLHFLDHVLGDWDSSMVAFDDMLDTRRTAFDKRLPEVDASLAKFDLERLEGSRVDLESRLATIDSTGDFVGLGTAHEQQQWRKVAQIEEALASAPQDEATDAMREKARLMKGVLLWQLSDAYKARLWAERRGLHDLDAALKEAQKRWVLVERARKEFPGRTAEFAARVDAMKLRIAALQTRLGAMSERQGQYLQYVAVAELAQQQERLATYRIQARYELATILDRAANPPPPTPPAGQAVPTEPPAETPPEPASEQPTPEPSQPAATGSPQGEEPVEEPKP